MQALKIVDRSIPEDTPLPQVIEAEEEVIGGLLLDPEAYVRVKDFLTPKMFSHSGFSRVFEVAIDLAEKGEPIDLFSVTIALKERGWLDKIGGQSFLATTVDRTISTANIDAHARLVRNYYYRRQLIQVGSQIQRLGHTVANPVDAMAQATEKLGAITKDLAGADRTTVDISEILVRIFDEFEKKLENPDSGSEIRTGYLDLDELLFGGLRAGTLTILAGRPGMGKSALVVDLLHRLSLAYPNRQNVLLSLEMSEDELGYRFLSRGTTDVDRTNGLSAGQIMAGRVRDEQLGNLYQAIETQSCLRVLVDCSPTATIDRIRSKLQYAKTLQPEGLGVLVVDYLQLMGDSSKDEGFRRYEVEKFSRAFKVMSQEFGIPIILLSQLSRAVEQRGDKRPQLSDLRESGAIEQDANNVLMLYRDDYYDPNSPDRGLIEVLLRKARNGKIGSFKLLANLGCSRFDNYAKG